LTIPAEERSGPPRRSLLGALALLLGSAALLCGSVFALPLQTLALGGIGVMLGGIGVWRGLEAQRGPLLAPAAGSVVSFLVLAVALFWPGLFGPDFRGDDDETDPNQDRHLVIPLIDAKPGRSPLTVAKGPPNSAADLGWVDASRAAVQVNDVRVQVVTAGVSRVKGKTGQADRECLVIGVRVTNVGAARIITFAGWSRSEDAVRLRDDLGSSYPHQSLTSGVKFPGQAAGPQEVFWGGRFAEDSVVFPVPTRTAQWLYLEFPGSACASPGSFRLAIPATMVRR
jgi:hypothetical protein